MTFTDRYIKLPIKLITQPANEDTGQPCELKPVTVRINPFEISHYYPSLDRDDVDVDVTKVVLKCGDSFFVYLHVKELETRLNNFSA